MWYVEYLNSIGITSAYLFVWQSDNSPLAISAARFEREIECMNSLHSQKWHEPKPLMFETNVRVIREWWLKIIDLHEDFSEAEPIDIELSNINQYTPVN